MFKHKRKPRPKRKFKIKARKVKRLTRHPRALPLAGPRRLQFLGRGIYLNVPAEWFKAHKLNPKKTRELFVMCDDNILIAHPKHEKTYVRKFSKFIREGAKRRG